MLKPRRVRPIARAIPWKPWGFANRASQCNRGLRLRSGQPRAKSRGAIGRARCGFPRSEQEIAAGDPLVPRLAMPARAYCCSVDVTVTVGLVASFTRSPFANSRTLHVAPIVKGTWNVTKPVATGEAGTVCVLFRYFHAM